MSDPSESSFLKNLKQGLFCKCPRCGQGSIYSGILELKETCDHCHLNIADNDNGDGPAVFLIFIFGFILVPLALVIDYYFNISLIAHAILWSVLGVIFTIAALRPTKAYVMTLIYHHRPDMWKEHQSLDESEESN